MLIAFGGPASGMLAESVTGQLGTALSPILVERFPDGELHVQLLASVRGRNVYVIQATGPPVEEHLLELLLIGDACRRAGALVLTAVIPYFGYARQDRRASGREPVAARLIADLLRTSGFDRVVGVDIHGQAIEGFFGTPLEHVSAVPLLTGAVRPEVTPDSVILAPDLGAAKLAEHFAAGLDMPVAIVHKTRLSGADVSVRTITGEVRGRTLVVVDDMISTAGTVEAAARAAIEAGALPDVVVVATHALLVGPAISRLTALPLRRLLVTDTVPTAADVPLPVTVMSVAPLLADVIRRLETGESLADLLVHV